MKRTIIIALSVVALVFGVISYASAIDRATTVNATVGTMLQLTAPASADMGELTPDVPKNVSVTVTGKSNRPATLTAAINAGTFDSLTSTVEATDVTGLRGGNISHTDTVTGSVDYFNDAAAVSGTITYSLVQ
ncbi:MAG: hypothetical protein VB139_09805 [Coriobacteriia bacterium]|nr:hypothetical protein [Coriobacteriia bacterium]